MAKGENKKIKNATEDVYNGIEFRSKLEGRLYRKMLKLGLNPEYETETIVLWNGFRPSQPFYIDGVPQITKKSLIPLLLEDWKYTPDFILRFGDCKFYLEAKGQPNDLWPYKRKLFLGWIEKQHNCFFFEVKTIRGLVRSIELMKQIAEDNEKSK